MTHKYAPFLVFGLIFFLPFSIWAQAPYSFSYQMVVRDSNAGVVKNGVVSIEVSLLQGSTSSQAVFQVERNMLLSALQQREIILWRLQEPMAVSTVIRRQFA